MNHTRQLNAVSMPPVLATHASPPDVGATGKPGGGGVTSLESSAVPLLTEVVRLRSEVKELRGRQDQVMQLIGAGSEERIVHDLRNLLNQMQLLKLLVDDEAC